MHDTTSVGAVTSPTATSGDVDPNGDVLDLADELLGLVEKFLLERLAAHSVAAPSIDPGEHALAVRRLILAGEALQ